MLGSVDRSNFQGIPCRKWTFSCVSVSVPTPFWTRDHKVSAEILKVVRFSFTFYNFLAEYSGLDMLGFVDRSNFQGIPCSGEEIFGSGLGSAYRSRSGCRIGPLHVSAKDAWIRGWIQIRVKNVKSGFSLDLSTDQLQAAKP